MKQLLVCDYAVLFFISFFCGNYFWKAGLSLGLFLYSLKYLYYIKERICEIGTVSCRLPTPSPSKMWPRVSLVTPTTSTWLFLFFPSICLSLFVLLIPHCYSSVFIPIPGLRRHFQPCHGTSHYRRSLLMARLSHFLIYLKSAQWPAFLTASEEAGKRWLKAATTGIRSGRRRRWWCSFSFISATDQHRRSRTQPMRIYLFLEAL